MFNRLSIFGNKGGAAAPGAPPPPGPGPKTDDAPKPGPRTSEPSRAPDSLSDAGRKARGSVDSQGSASSNFGGATAGATAGIYTLAQDGLTGDYQTTGQAKSGYYDLGFAEAGIEIDSFGQVMVDPGQVDTTGLEHAGYGWLGETGYLGLPTEMAPDALEPGEYVLPGGDTLAVWKDGSLLVEPANYDGVDALESAGFQWVGETGMMRIPEEPGIYTLPGGAAVQRFESMEPLVDPGTEPGDGLEAQGMSWAGETGMFSLPKSPEARPAAGQYPLPGGFSLRVRDGGDVFLDPGANDAAPLLAQGFKLVAVDKTPVLAFPGQ